MTHGTLLGILGLGIVESLNPSALVVTIALLSRPKPAARIFAYTAGIFVVFFSLGVAAVLGGHGVLQFVKDLRGRHIAYVLQVPIGIGMLAWAAWSLRHPSAHDRSSKLSQPPEGPVWSMFLLGLGVTLVEALTAFPYFGAIALLLDAAIPTRESILALVAFNLLFITPPLLLLWVTSTLDRRGPAFLKWLRIFVEREGRLTVLWLFIVIGAYLTLDAIHYFV